MSSSESVRVPAALLARLKRFYTGLLQINVVGIEYLAVFLRQSGHRRRACLE